MIDPIDLTSVYTFESRGRTTHVHYDGLEIQRTFYVEPFSSAREVVKALQGSVYQDGSWIRRLPAYDPYYPECYCNEARIDQVDPASISASPTLKPEDHPTVGKSYAQFMIEANTVAETARGGCFISASYRPLISGYIPQISPSAELGARPSDSELSKTFDYINPHFTPGIKTIPWPDGFQVAELGTEVGPAIYSVPDEVADPIPVPVIGFTIKRLLVGQIPWWTLNTLVGTVNKDEWPARPGYYTFPQFKPETLRFDTYEVIEHHSPGTPGGLWFEIVLHFSWLSLKDKPVRDHDDQYLGYADVTWNHAFMRPYAQIPLLEAIPVVGGLPELITARALGWYYVVKVKRATLTEAFRGKSLMLQVGGIYTLSDFSALFDLQSE